MTTSETATTPDPHLTEVEVTGVGLTPDKAEQHAYNVAIEWAVGVLVDSETLIENDQIVRDKILTYGKGFVEKFEVGRTWQEDGLHYVRAVAEVRMGEIVERLTAQKIDVKPLAGRDERLRLVQKLESEANATEMFARIMEDYRVDKLFRAELVGELKAKDASATHATLPLSVVVTCDMEKWEWMQKRLISLLDAVTLTVSEIECKCRRYDSGQLFFETLRPNRDLLEKRLEDPGQLINIVTYANQTGTYVKSLAYRVLHTFVGPLKDVVAKQYCLCYELLDEQGNCGDLN